MRILLVVYQFRLYIGTIDRMGATMKSARGSADSSICLERLRELRNAEHCAIRNLEVADNY